MPKTKDNSAILKIAVTPRSSKDRLNGFVGNELKIALAAPPVDGEANLKLIKFLSGLLNIKSSAIGIVSGQSSRHKTLRLSGIDQNELDTIINSLLSPTA